VLCDQDTSDGESEEASNVVDGNKAEERIEDRNERVQQSAQNALVVAGPYLPSLLGRPCCENRVLDGYGKGDEVEGLVDIVL
jgi:hypothetical protein